MGYEYLNLDQVLCVNVLLIQISLIQFAVCKWGLSRLRYLKTYMRSIMTEERLNGLAMLYVHREGYPLLSRCSSG